MHSGKSNRNRVEGVHEWSRGDRKWVSRRARRDEDVLEIHDQVEGPRIPPSKKSAKPVVCMHYAQPFFFRWEESTAPVWRQAGRYRNFAQAFRACKDRSRSWYYRNCSAAGRPIFMIIDEEGRRRVFEYVDGEMKDMHGAFATTQQ